MASAATKYKRLGDGRDRFIDAVPGNASESATRSQARRVALHVCISRISSGDGHSEASAKDSAGDTSRIISLDQPVDRPLASTLYANGFAYVERDTDASNARRSGCTAGAAWSPQSQENPRPDPFPHDPPI